MEDLPEEYTTSEGGPRVLDELFAVIKDRQREMPEGSYTAQLLAEGASRVAQKVIEEAGETALAAATGDTENMPGVSPNAVWQELRNRRA